MNKKLSITVSVLAAVITIVNVAFVINDAFYYNLDNLPKGNFIREDFDQSILFGKGYKLKVYQVEKTRHFPSAVRVELWNDNTNSFKTIYWQTNTEATIINWLDGDRVVVTINGVPIDIENQTYDCRDWENQIYVQKTKLVK